MEPQDYYLDHYMDQLKEDNLNEMDPVSTGAAYALVSGTAWTIAMIVSFLLATAHYRRSVKIDKPLSKRVNGILKSGSKWIVHIFPDVGPNAFAIGGRHVYITTGLLKILTDREVDAVLLHEVFHNKDMHVWRNVAAESAFLYLCAFISVTALASGAVVWPLAIIMFHIMRLSFKTIFARYRGRYFEIKSDEFAVKHGYGTELISALKKIEAWAKEHMKGQPCGKVCQLHNKISEEIDEHPPVKKRVEIILRKQKELGQAMNGGYKAIQKFVTGVFKQNG